MDSARASVADPHTGNAVECLGCGALRAAVRSLGGSVRGGECPCCGELGWIYAGERNGDVRKPGGATARC